MLVASSTISSIVSSMWPQVLSQVYSLKCKASSTIPSMVSKYRLKHNLKMSQVESQVKQHMTKAKHLFFRHVERFKKSSRSRFSNFSTSAGFLLSGTELAFDASKQLRLRLCCLPHILHQVVVEGQGDLLSIFQFSESGHMGKLSFGFSNLGQDIFPGPRRFDQKRKKEK